MHIQQKYTVEILGVLEWSIVGLCTILYPLGIVFILYYYISDKTQIELQLGGETKYDCGCDC